MFIKRTPLIAPNTLITSTSFLTSAKRYGVIFVVWLAAIVASASYFIGERLVEFDPDNRLAKTSKAELIQTVTKLSLYQNGQSLEKEKTTLFHINMKGCDCNDITREHVSTLNMQAQEMGYQVSRIVLSPDELAKYPEIPATPAVMLLGENNEFVYFGPYAQGLGCSETAGMVEVSMNNYHKGYNAEVVFADAKGCYCANENH